MITFKQYILEATKKDILAGLDKMSADRDPKGKMIYGCLYIGCDSGNVLYMEVGLEEKIYKNYKYPVKLPEKAQFISDYTFYIPDQWNKQAVNEVYLTSEDMADKIALYLSRGVDRGVSDYLKKVENSIANNLPLLGVNPNDQI